MPSRKSFVLVLLIAIIGIFLSLSFYYGIWIKKIEKLPMDMKVGDNIGFYSDTDALHFGTVYAGDSSKRSVRISNEYDYSVKVIVKNKGNFSKWIKLSENGFIIEPHGTRFLNYTTYPPVYAPIGKYSGMSIITIRRSI